MIIIISLSIIASILFRKWVNINPYLEKYIYRIYTPKIKRSPILTKQEIDAIDQISKKIEGLLLWASNREGNREIYLLKLPQKILKNLTRHPYQDSCPKFSPDGKWISFLRSHRQWVSFREEEAWNIWLINIKTEEAIPLIHGNHPSWTKDSQNIVFRKGNKIYKINIYTKEIQLIFDGINELTDAQYLEPILFDDKLALVIRSREFNGIGVIDLKTKKLTKIFEHRGCHITARSDYKYLYWIGHGGRGGTQVFYSSIDNPMPMVFMDLPSEYSHEYFPRISNNRKWLIWGASKGDHEHDIANYEIFLWEIGTPPDRYIRLTHSDVNNNYPDLYILE